MTDSNRILELERQLKESQKTELDLKIDAVYARIETMEMKLINKIESINAISASIQLKLDNHELRLEEIEKYQNVEKIKSGFMNHLRKNIVGIIVLIGNLFVLVLNIFNLFGITK